MCFSIKKICAEPKWPSARVVIYFIVCNVCFAWCVFHNRSQSFLAAQSNTIFCKPPNFPYTNENNLYIFRQNRPKNGFNRLEQGPESG